jgi:hypothetical protein
LAHKIANLVHIQQKETKAFETLKYRLPENVSVRVGERLSELERDNLLIDSKIDELANHIISKEGQESVDSPIFFTGKIDKLGEIRNLQLIWIEKLIDLDLNYGKI